MNSTHLFSSFMVRFDVNRYAIRVNVRLSLTKKIPVSLRVPCNLHGLPPNRKNPFVLIPIPLKSTIKY
jgi:hypothetical protein